MKQYIGIIVMLIGALLQLFTYFTDQVENANLFLGTGLTLVVLGYLVTSSSTRRRNHRSKEVHHSHSELSSRSWMARFNFSAKAHTPTGPTATAWRDLSYLCIQVNTNR